MEILMNYFVGLDVSLKRTAICVVDRDGNIIREGAADTEPETLAAWLKDTGLTFQRIGLEAGQCSSWLHKGLSQSGLPVICVETRHAKGVMQAQSVKTDRNDARALAQMMRTGWFKAVHVKSEDSQKLRVLMGSRRCLLTSNVISTITYVQRFELLDSRSALPGTAVSKNVFAS
jgi:transposase